MESFTKLFEETVPFEFPGAPATARGPARTTIPPYLVRRIIRLLTLSAIYILPALSVVTAEGAFITGVRPVLLSKRVVTTPFTWSITRTTLFPVSHTYRSPVTESCDTSDGVLNVEFRRELFTKPATPDLPAIVVTVVVELVLPGAAKVIFRMA